MSIILAICCGAQWGAEDVALRYDRLPLRKAALAALKERSAGIGLVSSILRQILFVCSG